MNTALNYRRQAPARKGISTYQQNQILNLSPTELILKIYDLIIISIKKEDISKANSGFTELIASLNFDQKEIAMGLFRLYRYCQECLRKNQYKQALQVVEDLRESWAKAFNLN
ncbi:MAG: flagellar export chaperone FliS [Calditrichia bacterium]